MFIAVCIGGVFVLDKDKVIDYKLFEKSPKKIIENLEKLERREIIKEIEELSKKHNLKFDFNSGYLRENMRKILIETKFVRSEKELNELINEITILKTKKDISSLEKRDKLLIQTISAINDLDKILNTMIERLREWYGLHYPELNVSDHERFLKNLVEFGHRSNFSNFKDSMGMELKEEDVKTIQNYAGDLKSLYDLRKNLERYLGNLVLEEIPNLSALLGNLLAARMLALAGSLENFAKMPSSTIQLLGAEKSLFRYLKGQQQRVPKFGIIYTHPDIASAKKEFQGKVARLLSAKLTLAARADFYSKHNMSKELLEDYKRKLKEIR